MRVDELTRKYMELREQLADAYGAARWQSGRIDRLAEQIVEIERALSTMTAIDEQTSEPMPDV